jgi:hypothetical protein
MTTNLQSYLDRQMTRVILNPPPGCSKSHTATFRFPGVCGRTQAQHTTSFVAAKASGLPTNTRRPKKKR